MFETFLILGSIYFLVSIVATLKTLFTKQDNASPLALLGMLLPMITNYTKPFTFGKESEKE